MKKILSIITLAFLVAGCGTGMANNSDNKNDNKTDNTNSVKTEYPNSGAVQLSASVSVVGSGNDEPFDEANDKISKISKVNVSLFDEKNVFINTYSLDKSEKLSLKGQIAKFTHRFIPVTEGKVKFKFVFLDNEDKLLFEAENQQEIKAKTIYAINGEIEQKSIKVDSEGSIEKLEVAIQERTDKEYVNGEMNVGLKSEMSEEDLKNLLEEKGFVVKSVDKIILSIYKVEFSSPNTHAGLIIADQTGKFEYVEPNYIATIQ